MDGITCVAADAATQVCRDCGRVLPLSEFKMTRWGGHSGVCRECEREKRKPYKKREPKRDIYSGDETPRGSTRVSGTTRVSVTRLTRNPLLKDFKPRELIDELRARGYEGTLRFVQEITL